MRSLKLHNFGPTLGILFLSAGSCCPALAQQQYEVVGISSFVPFGINQSSQIVGGPNDGSDYVAIWQAGQLTQLSPPGLNAPLATGINDAGEIVGSALDGQGNLQGFTWNSNSGFTNFSAPPGQLALTTCLNNNGEIGGAVQSISGGIRSACIWTSPQTPLLLPSLGNGDAIVGAINDNGIAIGDSGDTPPYPGLQGEPEAYGADHAVLWENGKLIDLTPNAPWSFADAINNNNEVVGWLVDPNTGVASLFEWTPQQGLKQLPGDGADGVCGINDDGDIVGYIPGSTPGSTLAAIWENGTVYDLNNLVASGSGWVLEQAYAINDLGDIVGVGSYNGQEECFVLTPDGNVSIPEPATISLSAGFCLLARRRWLK